MENDLLDERLEQYEIRIDLYRALAGGFETNRETQNNSIDRNQMED